MNIGIIGTGLIGASMGLALKRAGHRVCGTDINQMHLQQAVETGAIDMMGDLDETLSWSELVVLCVPVDATELMLPEILSKVSADAAVMDMGSTKLNICNAVKHHPNRNAYVAAHPMAGLEHSGPMAAHIDLFTNARVIVCQAQFSSSLALNKILGLLQQLKMKAIFMDADDHDRQLALVSHLPQFIAYALASLEDFDHKENNDWIELGGGGLQSSIRLGKSDAQMWMPIFQKNKAYLIPYINQYIEQLELLKNMVIDNHLQELHKNIKTANHNYERLNYKKTQTVETVEIEGSPRFFYS